MTKSIRSYPENERQQVITRRLLGADRGMGYYAAKDAFFKVFIPVGEDKDE